MIAFVTTTDSSFGMTLNRLKNSILAGLIKAMQQLWYKTSN